LKLKNTKAIDKTMMIIATPKTKNNAVLKKNKSLLNSNLSFPIA